MGLYRGRNVSMNLLHKTEKKLVFGLKRILSIIIFINTNWIVIWNVVVALIFGTSNIHVHT